MHPASVAASIRSHHCRSGAFRSRAWASTATQSNGASAGSPSFTEERKRPGAGGGLSSTARCATRSCCCRDQPHDRAAHGVADQIAPAGTEDVQQAQDVIAHRHEAVRTAARSRPRTRADPPRTPGASRRTLARPRPRSNCHCRRRITRPAAPPKGAGVVSGSGVCGLGVAGPSRESFAQLSHVVAGELEDGERGVGDLVQSLSCLGEVPAVQARVQLAGEAISSAGLYSSRAAAVSR